MSTEMVQRRFWCWNLLFVVSKSYPNPQNCWVRNDLRCWSLNHQKIQIMASRTCHVKNSTLEGYGNAPLPIEKRLYNLRCVDSKWSKKLIDARKGKLIDKRMAVRLFALGWVAPHHHQKDHYYYWPLRGSRCRREPKITRKFCSITPMVCAFTVAFSTTAGHRLEKSMFKTIA